MYLKLPDIYPYDLSRFKDDFPNTSPPDAWENSLLAQFGIVPVTLTPQPDFVFYEQMLLESPPQNVNGSWVQVWSVVDRTPEDKQLMAENKGYDVRAERDQRLRDECDTINPMRWEALSDEQKEQARAHRLALLDIPNQPGFPWNVTWPQNPF